jgi:hypothetical protein
MKPTLTPLDLEVHQYTDFPELQRKSSLVTVIGHVDMHTVEAKLTGVALMMGHDEPTPESEAEALRLAHEFKAAPRMLEALIALKNWAESLCQMQPELDASREIVLAYGAIWDANNEQRTWRDAIKISRARGEWTEEMEEHWGDAIHHGATLLPVSSGSERECIENGGYVE